MGVPPHITSHGLHLSRPCHSKRKTISSQKTKRGVVNHPNNANDNRTCLVDTFTHSTIALLATLQPLTINRSSAPPLPIHALQCWWWGVHRPQWKCERLGHTYYRRGVSNPTYGGIIISNRMPLNILGEWCSAAVTAAPSKRTENHYVLELPPQPTLIQAVVATTAKEIRRTCNRKVMNPCRTNGPAKVRVNISTTPTGTKTESNKLTVFVGKKTIWTSPTI